MQKYAARGRAVGTATLALLGFVGTALSGAEAPAQNQPPAPTTPGAAPLGGTGIPDDQAGERVLEQMLPDSLGTPAEDPPLVPATGDLGGGYDADPSGPLGRSSEAPLGRAGAAGGGGAIVGDSFGGGGVQVDGEPSGGGGVDVDRRTDQDLTPGIADSAPGITGSSPGLGN